METCDKLIEHGSHSPKYIYSKKTLLKNLQIMNITSLKKLNLNSEITANKSYLAIPPLPEFESIITLIDNKNKLFLKTNKSKLPFSTKQPLNPHAPEFIPNSMYFNSSINSTYEKTNNAINFKEAKKIKKKIKNQKNEIKKIESSKSQNYLNNTTYNNQNNNNNLNFLRLQQAFVQLLVNLMLQYANQNNLDISNCWLPIANIKFEWNRKYKNILDFTDMLNQCQIYNLLNFIKSQNEFKFRNSEMGGEFSIDEINYSPNSNLIDNSSYNYADFSYNNIINDKLYSDNYDNDSYLKNINLLLENKNKLIENHELTSFSNNKLSVNNATNCFKYDEYSNNDSNNELRLMSDENLKFEKFNMFTNNCKICNGKDEMCCEMTTQITFNKSSEKSFSEGRRTSDVLSSLVAVLSSNSSPTFVNDNLDIKLQHNGPVLISKFKLFCMLYEVIALGCISQAKRWDKGVDLIELEELEIESKKYKEPFQILKDKNSGEILDDEFLNLKRLKKKLKKERKRRRKYKLRELDKQIESSSEVLEVKFKSSFSSCASDDQQMSKNDNNKSDTKTEIDNNSDQTLEKRMIYKSQKAGILVSSIKHEWSKRFGPKYPLSFYISFFEVQKIKLLLLEVPNLVLTGSGGLMRVATTEHIKQYDYQFSYLYTQTNRVFSPPSYMIEFQHNKFNNSYDVSSERANTFPNKEMFENNINYDKYENQTFTKNKIDNPDTNNFNNLFDNDLQKYLQTLLDPKFTDNLPVYQKEEFNKFISNFFNTECHSIDFCNQNEETVSPDSNDSSLEFSNNVHYKSTSSEIITNLDKMLSPIKKETPNSKEVYCDSVNGDFYQNLNINLLEQTQKNELQMHINKMMIALVTKIYEEHSCMSTLNTHYEQKALQYLKPHNAFSNDANLSKINEEKYGIRLVDVPLEWSLIYKIPLAALLEKVQINSLEELIQHVPELKIVGTGYNCLITLKDNKINNTKGSYKCCNDHPVNSNSSDYKSESEIDYEWLFKETLKIMHQNAISQSYAVKNLFSILGDQKIIDSQT